MHEKAWHRANTGLLIAIVIITGYIMLAPVLPKITYWWQARHSNQAQQLQQKIAAEQPTSSGDHTPKPNGLIIPKMLLDTPIVEGPKKNSATLLHQAYRLPFSSTPDKGGNTVIASHRFSYTVGSHGTFYYLDKLSPGDEIGVRWNGAMRTYVVQSVRIVPPTEVSVQEQTKDDRLTLYTCTPIWNPVNRLVVVATPKENT